MKKRTLSKPINKPNEKCPYCKMFTLSEGYSFKVKDNASMNAGKWFHFTIRKKSIVSSRNWLATAWCSHCGAVFLR